MLKKAKANHLGAEIIHALLRPEGRVIHDVPKDLKKRRRPLLRFHVIDLESYSGVLTSASAYLSKHPPVMMEDEEARQNLEEFITGKLER